MVVLCLLRPGSVRICQEVLHRSTMWIQTPALGSFVANAQNGIKENFPLHPSVYWSFPLLVQLAEKVGLAQSHAHLMQSELWRELWVRWHIHDMHHAPPDLKAWLSVLVLWERRNHLRLQRKKCNALCPIFFSLLFLLWKQNVHWF